MTGPDYGHPLTCPCSTRRHGGLGERHSGLCHARTSTYVEAKIPALPTKPQATDQEALLASCRSVGAIRRAGRDINGVTGLFERDIGDPKSRRYRRQRLRPHEVIKFFSGFLRFKSAPIVSARARLDRSADNTWWCMCLWRTVQVLFGPNRGSSDQQQIKTVAGPRNQFKPLKVKKLSGVFRFL